MNTKLRFIVAGAVLLIAVSFGFLRDASVLPPSAEQVARRRSNTTVFTKNEQAIKLPTGTTSSTLLPEEIAPFLGSTTTTLPVNPTTTTADSKPFVVIYSAPLPNNSTNTTTTTTTRRVPATTRPTSPTPTTTTPRPTNPPTTNPPPPEEDDGLLTNLTDAVSDLLT